MARPLPLTVYGPVTPVSPAVKVTGVVPGADVAIMADGAGIGEVNAASGGESWVPLTSQPTAGQKITAVQRNADGTSEPSIQPLEVIDVPDPLPVPVIFSDLNTCMVDVWAGAFVPGATVITTVNGAPLGNVVAAQPNSFLAIDPDANIAVGKRLTVRQEVTVGGTTRTSPTLTSLQIPQFVAADRQLSPPVVGPLTECTTERAFRSVTPGASLALTNEGQTEFWTNPTAAYTGFAHRSLIKGVADVEETMPRCDLRGAPVRLPVGPAQVPGAPIASQYMCPQTLRIHVIGLTPGGILHVWRRVLRDPQGSAWTQASIGDAGIAYPVQNVDLPPDLALSDPDGRVVIALWQSNCAGESPSTIVEVGVPGGPVADPSIVEPLHDCGRYVPVRSARQGALVQVIDASTGQPLSDAFAAPNPDFTVPLWFPMLHGQSLLVRQTGCNADAQSAVVYVAPLPNPLPIPVVDGPVRPRAATIAVRNVIPGARLHLLVNGHLRPGSIDSLGSEAVIPVNGPPLEEDDNVLPVQTLCHQASTQDDRGVPVRKGTLNVEVSPSQAYRGSSIQVTVTARDADTGALVSGQVMLNGVPVGSTGVPFSYSPKPGDPNPVGVVREPIAYDDANFTIALLDVPVVDTWTLSMQAGSTPVYLDKIRIDVTEIKWDVTARWDVSVTRSVKVSPSPPAAVGSTTLPIPTGAEKAVNVTISGTAKTDGGSLNGFAVPAQTFSIVSATATVVYDGKGKHIGWYLEPKTEMNVYQTAIAFNLAPLFAGIRDN